MPHRVSHPADVPVFAGVAQRVLRLGTRPPSARAQENARLLARIHQLHADHDGVVGSPRIWEDLRYAGERCGRHRVARLMRRAGLQGVPQRRQWRKKPSRTPSRWNSESSEPGLQGRGPQYQMGHGYHLHSHGRTLVVPVRRAGFVFRPGRGLVDEPTSGPPVGGPSGADGLVAATGADPSHSALGSGLSVYLGGIPTVPGSAPRDLQHECGGQLCRQRGCRELLRRTQTGTRESSAVPDASRRPRADIFDYIERWHNPRQRRRLDMQQQAEQLLTQPSVITG